MTISKILDQFRPGRTIYLPGATGEIRALADALAGAPDRMDGVIATTLPSSKPIVPNSCPIRVATAAE